MEDIINKIRTLKSNGQLLEAKELSLEHIEESPNNLLLLYEVGDILRLQKLYKESTYFFKKAIDADHSKLRFKHNEKSIEKIISNDLRGALMRLNIDVSHIKEFLNADMLPEEKSEKIKNTLNLADKEIQNALNLIKLVDNREKTPNGN